MTVDSPPSADRPQSLVLEAGTIRGRLLVPVLIYIGLLVAVVSSLGSPLVPTIAADYRVSLGTAQWSLTITLLVGAIASPIVGRLGDGPHRQQVLLSALLVLVLGSVLAALPGTNFALLLLGRGCQGAGLSLLALVMSVARDHLDTERSRATLATLSVTAIVGVGLGYPLTGLVAEHFSFHAGFWAAAGLGVAAFGLALFVVPGSGHRPQQPFDLIGTALLAPGLGSLVLAISEGEEWGWFSVRLDSAAAFAVVVLGCWVWHELRTHHPLVDLAQLRHRTVLTANVTGVLAGMGMYMLMSMTIRYVQTPSTVSYGLGASVVVAGLLLLPLSAASFLVSKLVPGLSRRIGAATILPLGASLFGLSLALFATERDHLWQIAIELAIAGVGVGCSFAMMPRMIVSAVRAEHTSSALALNQVLRTIGYSVGSALAGTVLTAHTAVGARFPSDRGFTVGALLALGLCIVAAIVSWALPHRRPAPEGTGRELLIEENVEVALAGLSASEPGAGDEVSR